MSRHNNSFTNLESIISHLSTNEYPHLTWVGDNYSKADLIKDLIKIQNKPWYKKMGDKICKILKR